MGEKNHAGYLYWYGLGSVFGTNGCYVVEFMLGEHMGHSVTLRPSLTHHQTSHAGLYYRQHNVLRSLSKPFPVCRMSSQVQVATIPHCQAQGPLEDVEPSGHPHNVSDCLVRHSHQWPARGHFVALLE